MKRAFFFFFILQLFAWVFLQSSLSAQHTIPPPKKKVGAASTMSYAGGDRDTCVNKKFSLVIWMIQDSAGLRNASTIAPFIDTLIGALNQAFSRICVSFEKCSTSFIPHYTFDSWAFPSTDQAAIPSYYVSKTINVYIPFELTNFPSIEEQGYAYAQGVYGAVQNTLDVVVLKAGGLLKVTDPPIDPTTRGGAVHAFGHFFGLPDTYGELGPPANPPPPNIQIASNEFADESNSAVNGDLFTDTEADCFPSHRETMPYTNPQHCEYRLDGKDGKGQYYTPPLDNFMSGWTCRCRFTQQQYNYMAKYILKNRMYLH